MTLVRIARDCGLKQASLSDAWKQSIRARVRRSNPQGCPDHLKGERAHSRKPAARLRGRQEDYQKMMDGFKTAPTPGTYHKPGSLQ